MFTPSETATTLRNPTRLEMLEKMNHKECSPSLGVEYTKNFTVGLQGVLNQAFALPRDIDYSQHFSTSAYEKKIRMYFKGEGDSESPEERLRMRVIDEMNIAEDHPEIEALCEEKFESTLGYLDGKTAAIRWLTEQDRDAADACFPSLEIM